jgi:hypothetical protein
MVSVEQAPVAERCVRSRLFSLDSGMTDAEELRKNASICGDLGKRCKSDVERDQWLRMQQFCDQWLRMQQSWLALAENRDKLSREAKGNEAAPDPSSRGFASEPRVLSETDG